MFKNRVSDNASASHGWWLALAVCVSIPIVVWWQSVGDPRIYISYETPPGQLFYVFSELAGMYALFVAWLQILFVLLKQALPATVGRRWSLGFHRAFGLTVVGCVILHAVLFITAVSLRKAHVAFGLLWPNFEGFYATAVTLGLFGFYGVVVIAIAGFLRAAGRTGAVWLHYLAIPVFLFAYLHGLLIGTETRSTAMLALYAIMGVTLVAACIYRMRGRSPDKNKSEALTST